MTKANVEIRKAARVAEVPFWKIAQHIGISEPTLSRWLRAPLNPERVEKIMSAISELSREA